MQGGAFCASCGSATSGASTSSNTTAMWCHLGPLLASFVSVGWLSWLPPLLIRQSNPNDSYVNSQAVESLNFQLQWLIMNFALVILGFITCGVGFILLAAAGIFELVMMIMGSVAASKGEPFRYQLQFMTFVR